MLGGGGRATKPGSGDETRAGMQLSASVCFLRCAYFQVKPPQDLEGLASRYMKSKPCSYYTATVLSQTIYNQQGPLDSKNRTGATRCHGLKCSLCMKKQSQKCRVSKIVSCCTSSALNCTQVDPLMALGKADIKGPSKSRLILTNFNHAPR